MTKLLNASSCQCPASLVPLQLSHPQKIPSESWRCQEAQITPMKTFIMSTEKNSTATNTK